ncbi:proline racemase, partial [Bacillus thuringiensis]
RPPPQNSAKAKNLGGESTAHKSPIGSTNNQGGVSPTLIKVSLYLRT